MNFELFIAKRILFRKVSQQTKGVKPIIRIALLGVALSMAVMIIAIAVVTGFQKEIREKVIGFGSHVQITNYDSNTSFEAKPVLKTTALYNSISALKNVKHIQAYATKAGIIKTKDEIEGVVLKGIDKDFDWEFFKDKMISGHILNLRDTSKSNELLISKYTANRLKLKVDDKMLMYFIQDPPRVRPFVIAGIYETGLEELDKLFVIGDMRHVQRLNDWKENEVSGFEVLINDFNDIDKTGEKIYSTIGFDLNAKTIKEVYPQIFDWLNLQDINVIIIIVLMIIVAGINMISALLIIILERTNMIGILKALGCQDLSIRKVFLFTATYLTFSGMILGNILGLGLCFIQKKFGIITLPQESYYVSHVPINFSYQYFILLNIATLLVCFLMLLLPSYIITRITPVKAIRFE